MREAAANPRTTAAPTMPSDSRNCGFTFMSSTAANTSAIRTLREIFRMGSSRRLKNSDSSGAEARRSARIRLLVTAPRMPVRISKSHFWPGERPSGHSVCQVSSRKEQQKARTASYPGNRRAELQPKVRPSGTRSSAELKQDQSIDAQNRGECQSSPNVHEQDERINCHGFPISD
jgi:hypothetical protein